MKKLLAIFLLAVCLQLNAESKIVLVTGASKGIGKAISERLASHGHVVYATMRSPKNFKGFSDANIIIKELDVTHSEQIQSVISEIIAEKGRIDVIVNNAGYLLLGPCELLTVDELKAQFDTNFFGAVSMMQAVLPYMREQKSGHIINISSTSGFDPLSGFDGYAASKFALEGMSAAMAGYLNQFGIHISLIEPGPVRTELAEAMIQGSRKIEHNPYEQFNKHLIGWYQSKLKVAQYPDEIAEIVEKAIHEDSPRLRYQTNLIGVKRAQDNLVDITGNNALITKQQFVKELFDHPIDGSL